MGDPVARILIIEDNAINMKLATLLVRRDGHTTTAAIDAESGLLLARLELPDLILMDIQLPGMDGFAATEELKNDSITADIPVIALTAMAMSRDQDRARQAGCDAYITKPLRYQELHDAINWLISRGDDEVGPDEPGPPLGTPTPIALHDSTAVNSRAGSDISAGQSGQVTPRVSGATRILVAEDNPTNQKFILWQLTLLGYEADMAENGALAFTRWTAGDYDLVITDLHMPERNGYELASAIRASELPGSRTPILAMTASAMRGDADNARMVGINEYLVRPLNLVKLRAALLKWLPEHSDR